MPIRDELQRIYDAYGAAYRRKDAAGCAAVFTQMRHYISHAPAALGRDAVQVLHEEWVQLGGDDKVLTVFQAGQSGDLAWCLTRYADAEEKGTSLNLFERQSDGSWLLRACSLNEEEG